MSARAEMIGKKFNRLTPISVVKSNRVHLLYKCVCDCGNEVEVLGNSLREGNTKSCGCIRRPNLIGYENDNCVVVSKVKNQTWEVKCKHCGEIHVQNQREILNSARSKKCSKYRVHNYTGNNFECMRLQRLYGITLDDYNDMLSKQNHVCAICGQEEQVKTRGLAVDHCHTTGRVRGLLCSYCNMALGLFKDNTVAISSAIKYLESCNGR